MKDLKLKMRNHALFRNLHASQDTIDAAPENIFSSLLSDRILKKMAEMDMHQEQTVSCKRKW